MAVHHLRRQPELEADALSRYDAVCPTVSDSLDAAVLHRSAVSARILGSFGVGVNHIDLAACKSLGLVERVALRPTAAPRPSA